MTTQTTRRGKPSASATIAKLKEKIESQKIEVERLKAELQNQPDLSDLMDPLEEASAGAEVTEELYQKLSTEGLNFGGGKLYATILQPRHAEFLDRAAAREGRTEGQMIERLIRIGYAQDPYKAGAIDPETETGFSGRASDFKA